MPNRKLGKASDQRDAMLRNLTTALLYNGKIVTTVARAKEVRPIAEKLIDAFETPIAEIRLGADGEALTIETK